MKKGPALIDGSSQRSEGRRFESHGVPAVDAGHPGAQCDVRLTMAAHAEQVGLVRQIVGSLATSVGFSDQLINDVRLAVTEACTNVVRHAYQEAPGQLEVAAWTADSSLTVSVADRGCGLQPRPSQSGGGLGLPLMAALTADLEIEGSGSGGTTVRLSFAADG
jgi:serine/threonine-protein kinase RsbW